MTTATLPMLEAVSQVIEAVRERHEGIPEVLVVLGASAPTKHGHFAPKSWTPVDDDQGAVHEILLSGESLKRGGIATFGTIVHELAHAYCHANDIQDTSNRGRYHNRRFKRVAEDFGLALDQAPTIGWSVTRVPDETVHRYADQIASLDSAITAYRRPVVALAASPTPRAKYRLVCRCGNDPIPVSKKFLDLDITCNVCGSVMDVNELE